MRFPCQALFILFVSLSSAADLSAQPVEFFQFTKYDLPLRSHSGYHPNAVAFSADGKLMASGADDTIAVWEVKTQKLLTRMQYPEKQYSIHVVFSTDGKALISNARNDRMVRFWDVRTGKQIREVSNPKSHPSNERYYSPFISFSPNGELMLAHRDRDSVALVEIATCKITTELKGAQAGSWVGSAFSADGSIVATGSGKSMLSVNLWNVKTGEFIGKLGERRQGWHSGYTFVTFSPNGKYLITAATGATRKTADVHYLSLWGVADGKRYCQFEARAGFNLATMSKDERILVAHSMDRSGVRVFDLRENNELPTVAVPEGACYNLSTTPDGNTLVFLGGRGVVDSPTAVYLAPFPDLRPEKLLLELDGPMQKKLWDGLCGDNEFRRQHVLTVFKKHAEQAVYLAKEKVRPVPEKQKQQVESRIKQLDDDSADVRDTASVELRKVAHEFEPLLSAAAKKSGPGEIKNRLTRILTAMRDPEEPLQPSVDLRSELAGISLLKYLGTEDAKRALEGLAAGAAGTRVTNEAAAALKVFGRK